MFVFKPSQYQVPFKGKDFLQSSPQKPDLELDVLFIGGGPAGLSGAIRLKQLCQKHNLSNIQVGVMEKSAQFGGHILSGAVINPVAFHSLFPDVKDLPFRQKVKKEKLFFLTKNKKIPLPLPPTMKNKNFYTASLCEVIRWMAKKATQLDITLMPAFTAHKLLVQDNKVKGISTYPSGLNKDATPSSSYQKPVSVQTKLLILADGCRGHLSQAWREWKNIPSHYPATYALGVKEIWELAHPLHNKHTIYHTMGWPLPSNCFGGAWLYPLDSKTLSLGMVAGLDSSLQNLDVHLKLQQLKTHPLFADILKNGKCIEWGAKTIPEGGYHSIPQRLCDDGLLIAGDSANMVNVPALKGIHYAITAGMLTAQTALSALKANDFSYSVLKEYEHKVRHKSCIGKELYPVRNVRQAFRKNLFLGLVQSGMMFLTKGMFPPDRKALFSKKEDNKTEDAYKTRHTQTINTSDSQSSVNSASTTINKTTAVYLSGNKTRDDIPMHLKSKSIVPKEVQKFYTSMCPAGVYEQKDEQFIINAPNCVDCKATDILGPRWTPKEGGTGPNYQKM